MRDKKQSTTTAILDKNKTHSFEWNNEDEDLFKNFRLEKDNFNLSGIIISRASACGCRIPKTARA